MRESGFGGANRWKAAKLRCWEFASWLKAMRSLEATRMKRQIRK